MNSLYETLKEHQQHVTHWCYGHFHQSWHSSIDGTSFKPQSVIRTFTLFFYDFLQSFTFNASTTNLSDSKTAGIKYNK